MFTIIVSDILTHPIHITVDRIVLRRIIGMPCETRKRKKIPIKIYSWQGVHFQNDHCSVVEDVVVVAEAAILDICKLNLPIMRIV